MAKADNSDQLRPTDEPLETGSEPEDDAEGHLFMPSDPGTARALAGDRMREVNRGVRERALEREAKAGRSGRTKR